ncbi:MAG: thioredoxin family protein [Verrucomicrobiales bacterium]|nr:thioredoxin family protein [Verrucomicrobiales bacterium]
MAEVPSTFQLKPGASAPDFELPDGAGSYHQLSNLIAGKKGLLVAFVCNHCPFVVHLAKELGDFAREIASGEIQTVAISANDVANYPADSPEKMVQFAEASGWDFPYLYDESQEVAKAYAAACTPDFYLFDSSLKLTYAGQFDNSRPGRGEPTGDDMRNAVRDLLSGETTPEPWYPSSGCNIKWKPGESPDYFG